MSIALLACICCKNHWNSFFGVPDGSPIINPGALEARTAQCFLKCKEESF